jgi:hypothetical protein
MTSALEYVRNGCGMAGEEVAAEFDKMELEIAELKQQHDELHDNLYELIDFARELVSIVKIHSNATGNNFAWAELESMENAIAKAVNND